MEFLRFFSLVYDDFPDFMRRVDRTVVGLHESRRKRGMLNKK